MCKLLILETTFVLFIFTFLSLLSLLYWYECFRGICCLLFQ